MMKYQLSDSEAENYESDGFGEVKSLGGNATMKVWINVRRDSQIPEFDAVTDFKWYAEEGFEDFVKYTEQIGDMLTEATGLFVEEALKIKAKDICSMLGEELEVGETIAIPTLRALENAICDYFEKSGQLERKRKVTEKIICRCRYVTDKEIEEAAKKSDGDYEYVQNVTGAGTGCQSCVIAVKAIVDKYKKTAIGELK